MLTLRLISIAVISSFLLSGCFLNKTKVAPTVLEGKSLPNFVLETFGGQKVNLSQREEKAVFIDFWGAWSKDSLTEMPIIDKISQDNKNDLLVWGIHRGDAEDLQTGTRFAIDRGVSYQLVNDKDGSVYRAFVGDENFMPVAAFVDKNGIVIKILYGPKTEAQMRRYVKQAIGGDF